MTGKALIAHYEPLTVHCMEPYTRKEWVETEEDGTRVGRDLMVYRDADNNPVATYVTFYRPDVGILHKKDDKGRRLVHGTVAADITLAPISAIIGNDAVANFKLAVGQVVNIHYEAEVGLAQPSFQAKKERPNTTQLSRRFWGVKEVEIVQEAPEDDPEWSKSAASKGATIEHDEVVEELPW